MAVSISCSVTKDKVTFVVEFMQELVLDTTQTKLFCLLKKQEQPKTKAPTPQDFERCFQLNSIHNPLNKGEIIPSQFSMIQEKISFFML